ncbi:MAG: ATP-binding protein [Bdellovibrionaceae bacterium]|nr:ATP-binding protein [Pseudobdellovibrionaceae bacterium]
MRREKVFSAIDSILAIAVTDPEGKIEYINDLFVDLTGFTAPELLGTNYLTLLQESANDLWWEGVWQDINSSNIWTGEVHLKARLRDNLILSSVAHLLRDSGGGKKLILAHIDITKQAKIRESSLEERVRLTEESIRKEMREIASGFAHEINNPISIILGKAHILKKKMGSLQHLPEDIKKEIDNIEKNVLRVAKLIRNFRNFSYGEKDELSLEEGISLEQIWEDSKSLFLDKIQRSSINLFEFIEKTAVYCSPSQIQQILINLILNSIYAIKDLDDKWIRVEAKNTEGDFVEISVTDSGKGIPEEIRSKIMHPFFTTKPAGDGTGMGLYVSWKIAQEHGGDFYYDANSPNTRFVLLLPKSKSSVIGSLNAERAVTAHLNWKSKLLEELAGGVHQLTPDKVGDYTACELGRWIQRTGRALESDFNFTKLRDVHMKFHAVAAEILRRIHWGEREKIKLLLEDSRSEYNKLSAEIVYLLKEISRSEKKAKAI